MYIMSSFFKKFVVLVFITLTGTYYAYYAYIVFIICVFILRSFLFPYRWVRLSILRYLHTKKNKCKKLNLYNYACKNLNYTKIFSYNSVLRKELLHWEWNRIFGFKYI